MPSSASASGPTLLERMVAVGAVTPRSVRLWARLDRPTTLTLELRSASEARRVAFDPGFDARSDGTCAFTYPDDFPGEPPLPPLTRHELRLLDAHGALVGEARFETAPARPEEAPAKWSFGFMSCHQPFDEAGRPSAGSLAMLDAAYGALAGHDAKLAFFIGDQIYADEPESLSVFTPREADGPALLARPPAQIRARYHQQYRRFWNLPPLQRLHASFPTVCVPDDHEIVNNWGSLAEHLEPRWQALRDAALEACYDYEGSRSFRRGEGPLRFSQAFEWGNAGFFVLDVRAERRHDGDGGQVVGDAQLDALDAFLAARAHLDALFVIVPVPLVHIPDWMTAVGEPVIEGEVDDRWSQPRFAPSRDRLLERVAAHARRHPRQRIALLSGDIHAGWAIGLRDEPADAEGQTGEKPGGEPRTADDARPLFYQFVSSALTNQDSCLAGALSKALIKITGPLLGSVCGFRVGPLCGAEQGKNPFGGLNVGVVELERAGGEVTIRFKIVSHEADGAARPVVVFDSGPL